MKNLGIIGYPLTHSFSGKYFKTKFKEEKIDGYFYGTYEIDNIDKVSDVITENSLIGFNVTIPYKQQIIPYLNEIDETAKIIGAVNCVKVVNGKLTGYNTDIYGFEISLLDLINDYRPKALVLGTGGASKAVCYVLNKLNIDYKLVSRNQIKGGYCYEDLNETIINERQLIINTTPLGTYPNCDSCPDLPYNHITNSHYIYDLVYNPSDTLFIRKARYKGAKVISGYKMLKLQAEKGWDIFSG